MRSTFGVTVVVDVKFIEEGFRMLTDMTPGHLYGAQIPGMTVNVKAAVSL